MQEMKAPARDRAIARHARSRHKKFTRAFSPRPSSIARRASSIARARVPRAPVRLAVCETPACAGIPPIRSRAPRRRATTRRASAPMQAGGDLERFCRAYSVWCPPLEPGDAEEPHWFISALNEPLDLERGCSCARRSVPTADHAPSCAFSVLPTNAEHLILSAVASRVDPPPDERGLSFAYASGRGHAPSATFVVEHTWTPEALRGRGLGKKVVRGCAEFVAASEMFGKLPGRTREERYEAALARHVDATCSYAKRAIEELRREAGL